MNPEDLITYCGVYGRTCARWCEYTEFRELAAVFSEWVNSQGFHHWMPGSVKEFDYAEFIKGLEFFSKDDTWLVCRKCCGGGDGRPECGIRNCCQERELDICFDCEEFPCDKVQENTRMIERANGYTKLGRDEWLRQQVEKANQGFELHTEKYYQMWTREYPPTQCPHRE